MVRQRHTLIVTAAAALLASGCGETRNPEPPREEPAGPTFVGSVQQILGNRCVSCHGGSDPAGDYDLSSYQGTLGPGLDDTHNVVAGDGTSRLLTKLDRVTNPDHWEHLRPSPAELQDGEDPDARRQADFRQLVSWVVNGGAAYFDVSVHPRGWLYPGDRNDPNFHGGALRANLWDLDGCRPCHGDDLRGGSTNRSCYSCHERGPLGCTTCHGSDERQGFAAVAPPGDLAWNLDPAARGVGAHQQHLRERSWWAPVSCDDCHRVPDEVFEPGHLLDLQPTVGSDLEAELLFGTRARLQGVDPSYDRQTLTCQVYCHGAHLEDRGLSRRPVWNRLSPVDGRPIDGRCSGCHPVPWVVGGPDCSNCHPRSVDRCTPGGDRACLQTAPGIGVRFKSPALHGDGEAPLGFVERQGCARCHGTLALGGARPPDLAGNSDMSALGVGLHEAHLTGGKVSDGVPCESCHVVPDEVDSPGHLDQGPPVEVTFSPAARGAERHPQLDTQPTWDRTSATCSNLYCHDLSGGAIDSWRWTETVDDLSCTSCHGMPPEFLATGPYHPAAQECIKCHSSAYDSDGRLDRSKHINGTVEQ